MGRAWRQSWGGGEVTYLETIRDRIEDQYKDNPTGTGGSFGEILCHEIHENGLTFLWLAAKWGISVTAVGELIYDHCKRLEKLPEVNHEYRDFWVFQNPKTP